MLGVYFILSFFLIVSCDNDEEWLNCKPRPGCSIARCDPRPLHWFINGGEPDEYSILCQKTDGISSSEISELKESAENMDEEIVKLKGRLERNEDDVLEMKLELRQIRKENAQLKKQMENQKKECEAKIKEGLEPIEELQAKVTDFERLVEKLNKQPTTAPSSVTTTEKETVSSTTTTPTTSSESTDLCAVTYDGVCYWAYLQEVMHVRIQHAAGICSRHASIPAFFPSEEVYTQIVKYIRSKIPSGWGGISAWTGVTIDTTTGKVTYPSEETFVKWNPHSSYPRLNIPDFADYKYVRILVKTNINYKYQGMENWGPTLVLRGVICQRRLE